MEKQFTYMELCSAMQTGKLLVLPASIQPLARISWMEREDGSGLCWTLGMTTEDGKQFKAFVRTTR